VRGSGSGFPALSSAEEDPQAADLVILPGESLALGTSGYFEPTGNCELKNLKATLRCLLV